jgi:hypothetical protein
MAGRPAESPEEAVRRLVELYNQRAWDVFEKDIHPAFEFESVIMSMVLGPGSDQRVYHGLAGLRRWTADIDEAFDEVRFESLELSRLGQTAAFELARLVARGRGSRIRTDLDFARLWEFEGGLVRRIRTYRDVEEARRAAAELEDAAGEVPGP